MFLFTIKARPDPANHEIGDDVGGAYINVWVNFPEQEAAEVIAKFYITDSGWIPELTTDISWVVEENYNEEDEDREYFLEALTYGSFLVCHQWPKDAEDSNTEYEID